MWGYALPQEPGPNLFASLASTRPAGSQWDHHTVDLTETDRLADVVQECQLQVRVSYADPLGTWRANLLGTLLLLEALKQLQHRCAVVMDTAIKAAIELAVAS